MDKIAYIAGPNGGGKGYEQLKKAETYLEGQGFLVTSMHESLADSLTREQYLHEATKKIVEADCVYFLDGWRNSDAAQTEHTICTFLEKPVRYFWK